MKHVLYLLVLLLSLSSFKFCYAFTDLELSVLAAQYQQSILDRHGQIVAQIDRDQELRQALIAVGERRWDDAITKYEALIAADDKDSYIWLRLSEAWRGDAKRRSRISNDRRQRALQAAFNAYQVAQSKSHKARALIKLGEFYQLVEQPKQALDAWQEALALVDDSALAERYQALVAASVFQVKDLAIESNSARPQICLQFSEELARGHHIHYEDYVRIQPATQIAVIAQENKLCIEGVAHGESYQITLRPGLAAKTGDKIRQQETFTATISDREASVGFRGAAYVLPKSGSQLLPLTSVNANKARIQVLRINDRSLVSEIDNKTLRRMINGYSSERIKEHKGELVWQGELDINNVRNQEVTTALPMQAILQQTKAGIYIVTAINATEAQERWRDLATQWLVVSDIGITTLQGDDGLHVFLRSLDSATALANISLQLLARNNSVLAKSVTDERGYSRFDPGLLRASGGLTATALLAYSDGNNSDFNFIDLTRPSFDLSDRGVSGRKMAGAIDAFLYGERGVYRPGEDVPVVVLLRDQQAKALADGLPLTLQLVRPDQVVADELLLNNSQLGGYQATFSLAENARSGRWQVRAYVDPAADPVGQLSFLVEDFVPQRIRLTLAAEEKELLPSQAIKVAIDGQFLYGAPAANLNTSAELVLREDTDPYPDFPGYQFGLAQDEWSAKRFELTSPKTDESGNSQIMVKLDEIPDTTRPLKALLRVSLFEPGGRPVNRVLGLPYRTQAYAIGIKPYFDDDTVALGQQAQFAVIAVDAQGQQIGIESLRYQLYKEEYDYYWYHHNNRWDYKLIIRDSDEITSQTLQLSADNPLELNQSGLEWGRYRAEIYDPRTGIASSIRFRVGWFADPSVGDTPDKLQLTLDKDNYLPGETARVRIKAPFSGQVLLSVADHRLRETFTIDLAAEGTTFELPVTADWGPGVYLLATAFRPGDTAAAKHGPGRAIGVSWLALNKAPRTLQLSIKSPADVKPRQTINVPVSIENALPGEQVFVTLAAVDQGILQLTDYATPDPVDFYLGKRRLGIEVKDIYGQLIKADGRQGRLKVGGDMAGRNVQGSGVRTVKTVALFNGPVQLGSDSEVSIPLHLPDFNGELRLMAIAWDKTRVGTAEQTLLVRDPVVARLYLPRFLAVDDVAQLTLNVQNLNAPVGTYQVKLIAGDAVALKESTDFDFIVSNSALQNHDQKHYPLRALRPGVGNVTLQLTGPDGFSLSRDWQIGVRAAQTITSTRTSQRLDGNQTLQLNDTLLNNYVAGTGALQLRVSSRPGLNVPALLQKLDRYPYGCLEQTTSRALPLLYFNQVAENWLGEHATEDVLAQRVQEAIRRVLSMQKFSGGFGLWNENSHIEYWLSAYALDFLTRAREIDYFVPNNAYQRGLDWLQKQLNQLSYNSADLAFRAYALYVLARAQQAPLGELRYLHDNFLQQLPSQLARAQLGAALAHYGDVERARKAFRLALSERRPDELRDYGSPLRDHAATLALLTEANVLPNQIGQLAAYVSDAMDERRYTSTQEQVWLLLAAHALSNNRQESLQLAVNGRPLVTDQVYYLTPTSEQVRQGIELSNQGTQAAWYSLYSSGVPKSPQPPEQQGFTVSRRYYNRRGEIVDPAQVEQNETLVAVISGKVLTDYNHQALIVDLLPAGLELENARLGHGDTTSNYDWLPALSSTVHTELRDDRYVAALDLENGQREFTLAYLARAVTPGEYTLPAVFIEDMYKPWYYGRGTLANLTVK